MKFSGVFLFCTCNYIINQNNQKMERTQIISLIRTVSGDIKRNTEYYNMLVDYQIDIPNNERKIQIKKIRRNLRIWKNEIKTFHRQISKIDSES